MIIIITVTLCQEYLEVIMSYFVNKREKDKRKENTIDRYI